MKPQLTHRKCRECNNFLPATRYFKCLDCQPELPSIEDDWVYESFGIDEHFEEMFGADYADNYENLTGEPDEDTSGETTEQQDSNPANTGT